MNEIQTGAIAVDVAARHAQVLGDGPRIEPLDPKHLTDDALELVRAIRASVGVDTNPDDIPGYFLTMMKHPPIFACQLEMGTALFKGAIPARERELAVLRIGWLCRAPYEWGQHVDIARRYGVTDAEIARVPDGSSAPGWPPHEAAILRGVEELLGDKALSQETWDALARTWNEMQLIEFPMMVGQYVATAYVQNSLRIRLTETNPGLTAR